jgi:hypothetical protein
MRRVLAFGQNFGNIRKGRRKPMDELVRAWNDRWNNARSGVRVVDWYRPTGNFVLELAKGGVIEAIQALQDVEPARRFAVFDLETFQDWLVAVRQAVHRPPAKEPDLRWTPGMVMDTDPEGPEPEAPAQRRRIHFGPEVRPRLMMVWKPDRLLPGRQKLDADPKSRGGGWGSIASAMGPRQRWTARSLGTVEGLYAVARVEVPKSIPVDASASSATRAVRTTKSGDEVVAPLHSLLIARRDAERLARSVCARAGLDIAGKRFIDVCVAIEQAHLMSPKELVYLHALRRLGNMAAHPEIGVDFSDSDREIALRLLHNLVDGTQP